MRNPKWQRDEIILALDLYFNLEPGQMHARNDSIIELSNILNQLPIHENRPDEVRFRNPNGVALKLSNFLAIDSNYPGKGMASYSNQDKSIFEEFKDKRLVLQDIAHRIKNIVQDDNLRNKVLSVKSSEQPEEYSAYEGKIIYKFHKSIERDPKIVLNKKKQVLKLLGTLSCEICNFNFYNFYGEIGEDYIECHHKNPLNLLKQVSKTSLHDLALVCANCHRMLHRKMGIYSIDKLLESIENNNSKKH